MAMSERLQRCTGTTMRCRGWAASSAWGRKAICPQRARPEMGLRLGPCHTSQSMPGSPAFQPCMLVVMLSCRQAGEEPSVTSQGKALISLLLVEGILRLS